MTPQLTAINGDNIFIVGLRGEKVVSLKLNREFTREEALNLAAWLVTLVDTGSDFGLYLEKVQGK